MIISVLIPTLNEASTIGPLLHQLRDIPKIEILVCDCDSADDTVEQALRGGATIVAAEPTPNSRARALNAAAAEAKGDILLFLHADSILPPNWTDLIRAKIGSSDRVIGGAFEFKLDGPQFGLRVIEFTNRVRYRVWPYYYGDQGIWIRREIFEELGGYPDVRLMEDAIFCQQVKRQFPRQRMVLIKQNLLTSPRRFIEGGIWKVFGHDIRLWLRFKFGRSNEAFADAYAADNHARGHPKPKQPSSKVQSNKTDH